MPGPVGHLALLDRMVERLPAGERPGAAAMRALRVGSVAPDMGYYPGADRLITDLSHYVGTVQLVRAMLDRAESAAQRWFAWGWLSHVLADAAVHPLVNAAAGRAAGAGSRALTYHDDPGLHARVEVGLEIGLAGGGEGAAPERWSWDPALPRLLSDAYCATYGIRITPWSFARGLASVERWAPRLVRIAALQAAAAAGRPVTRRDLAPRLLLNLAAAAARFAPRDGFLFAATHPLTAGSDLAGGFRAAAATEAERLAGFVAAGAVDHPDVNLDTGLVDRPGRTYPLTTTTLRRLDALRRDPSRRCE